MKTRPDKLGLQAGLSNYFTIRSSKIPVLLVRSHGTDRRVKQIKEDEASVNLFINVVVEEMSRGTY
jgi:hypothetical protein